MNGEGRDSTQIFIGLMVLMAAGSGVWAGYTYNKARRYRAAREAAIQQYPELQRIAARIEALEGRGGPQPKVRTLLFNMAERMRLNPAPVKPRDATVGEHREHSYEVVLGQVRRDHVVRYIHRVRQELPALRARVIEMDQTERSAPPDDLWNWKVEFAYREKLEKK